MHKIKTAVQGSGKKPYIQASRNNPVNKLKLKTRDVAIQLTQWRIQDFWKGGRVAKGHEGVRRGKAMEWGLGSRQKNLEI